MTTLNALAKQAAKGTSTEGVCHAMIATLGDVPDISWLSIYAQRDDAKISPEVSPDAGQGVAQELNKSGHRGQQLGDGNP